MLAKFFGSYENLHKSKPERLLKLLTGFPVTSFKLGNFDEESLYSKMEEAEKNGYLVLAYADEGNLDKKNTYKTYFEKDYFYPIVAAVKADSHKMVFVRNVWKKKEFPGIFYKSHDKLSPRVVKQIEMYDDTSIVMMGTLMI